MDITAYLNLKTVLTLTLGFGLASFLGYFSHLIKLSPLLGYLLAGYLIGPYSPGFVGDMHMAEQLAEVGVILMMFGVGLHFKVGDLLRVKHIAVPGAFGQTLATTFVGALVIYSIGWGLKAGVIYGLAIGVASTVALVYVLMRDNLLETRQGQVSVGWLVVEDLITIFALLLLPALVPGNEEALSPQKFIVNFSSIVIKFIFLILILFTLGRLCVRYILTRVVRVRSHELFTVTILAVTFAIAMGSTLLFGTSLALGAFLAGMIVGQTDIRHQVSVNATPLRDAFLVIFFISIGMLFNPAAIWQHPFLFLATLGIVLLVKPLVAYFIVFLFKGGRLMALTVAVALAQIGEFSFILTEQANKLGLFPDVGYDIIVACAFISISINPALFKIFKLSAPQNAV